MSAKKKLGETAEALMARHRAMGTVIVIIKSNRSLDISFVIKPGGPQLPEVVKLMAAHLAPEGTKGGS